MPLYKYLQVPRRTVLKLMTRRDICEQVEEALKIEADVEAVFGNV